MEEWKTLRIELAREALRRRLLSENQNFRTISNPSENHARTRTAKEKHFAKLKSLEGTEEIPDADDSSVYKRLN